MSVQYANKRHIVYACKLVWHVYVVLLHADEYENCQMSDEDDENAKNS